MAVQSIAALKSETGSNASCGGKRSWRARRGGNSRVGGIIPGLFPSRQLERGGGRSIGGGKGGSRRCWSRRTPGPGAKLSKIGGANRRMVPSTIRAPANMSVSTSSHNERAASQ